jgi:predicted MPP superfamily phosphohydrolase
MHDASPHRQPSIPPDRKDGSSTIVHRALIWTGHLGELSPWRFLPLYIGLSALIAWAWSPASATAGLAFLLWLILDGVMLAWLPRTARSWGPVTPPLLGLTGVRFFIWLGGALLSAPLGLALTLELALTLGANLTLSVVAIYATWVEPFQVRVTYQTYPHSAQPADTPPPILRILHLSDLHFEAWSHREYKILDLMRELQPDLVLLTGDYLNLSSVYDPAAQAGARDFLSQLEAPLGVYAVTGSPAVDISTIVPGIFDDLAIRWLNDKAHPIEIEGTTLWLLGVRNTYNEERDLHALRELAANTPNDQRRLLLYHTPDLMPEAAQLGIDLYLCGHTHGGQICLPFYGAVATSSKWGKQYEHGRYQEATTTLYVSRGLGMEGLGAPRVRFLAPPEIILWHLA